ncbi:hypothetical protein C8Q73DRAFT_202510 [Cubamyces lactineus]|nr:hypothetical protein C8Q73DRAFT_202510 [Cubamyces lactineus]
MVRTGGDADVAFAAGAHPVIEALRTVRLAEHIASSVQCSLGSLPWERTKSHTAPRSRKAKAAVSNECCTSSLLMAHSKNSAEASYRMGSSPRSLFGASSALASITQSTEASDSGRSLRPQR